MLKRLKDLAGAVGSAAIGTAGDFVRGVSRETYRQAIASELALLPRLATETLPWLVRSTLRGTVLDAVVRHAAKTPHAHALRQEDARWTWAELDACTSRVAWTLERHGVRRGDVVALLGPNAPEYIGWVLGCTRIGATCALLNTHLEAGPLAHAIRASAARLTIAHDRFSSRVEALGLETPTLVYGRAEAPWADAPSAPYPPAVVDAEADYVYIFTSGTTGFPKPCRISHGRALMAGAGFAALMFRYQPGDVLYNVLPLYHASGLMLGAGSALLTGTAMAIRDGFSARSFWSDVRRYDASAIVYIGELCRYLVNNDPQPDERSHRVRVAVGNGLRSDVWPTFEARFGIPEIREFYGATEAPGAIMNLTGRVGSVGRVPVRRSGQMVLVRYDVDRDEHLRDPSGHCIECEADEVGELLVRLAAQPLTAAGEYRGYTDAGATQSKILEHVFAPGDKYFRTGDLLRRDEDDYFYFVDRIGDTFRWKGENVSTAEVADTVARVPGVAEATIVGVEVPGMDGRAGLAALVLEPDAAFDGGAFFAAIQELPAYAQPVFVRLIGALETTGTYKIQKGRIRKDGCDPSAIEDSLYVRTGDTYVTLDTAMYARLRAGELRL